MGIIDEWYTVFQKIKIPHGSILPVGLISQTFELYFPAFSLARCSKTVELSRVENC